MTLRDDEILERVLQRVDHPRVEDPGLDLAGEERRLWREYTELAGLLPYALEPVPPRPGQREQLLARARRETFAAEPRSEPARRAAPAARAAPRAGWSAAAAAIAALALGLAVASGWLIRDRAVHLDTIAALEDRLAESGAREEELRDARAELTRLRGVFASASLRVCPLRPWGERPAQPVARAAVYYDGEREQWLLAARDLEPCRQGSYYVLWFVVDGKPVPGGAFRPERGVPVALTVDQMPAEMGAAFLTLEPDPTVGAPTGPPILYGEDTEEML